MKLKKKYEELKDDLLNVYKETSSRILNILETPGSTIIKATDLESNGKVPLEKILILSKNMRQAIEKFNKTIKNIGFADTPETGSLFYIAEYGGSKTQFIELINSIINDNKERSIAPFNRVIPIVFNGIIDLSATYLGEQIEQQTAKILSRELDRLERERKTPSEIRAFESFLNLLVEFRKVKNAPEHLERIHSLLTDVERTSHGSVGLGLKISKIRNELSQLPLIDEEKLFNIVFEIMKFASRYNVVFIFFFDECDEWLAKGEQESIWDQNFIKRQYFFRKLYDSISELRLYQIYCFTPRIHEALRSEKSDRVPGIHRLSSDLTKYISSSSSHSLIREEGIYQANEATEAVLKWLILLEKSVHLADPTIFDSFLDKLINKIDNKLSRRKANGTIIAAIRAYIQLAEYIKYGQNQYDSAMKTPAHQLAIGKIIEDTFSSYLNFLNFSFEKKHHGVGGGKSVDGRFSMGVKGREFDLYAEIKSFNKPESFEKGKADQVINCVQNLHQKVIFFLFCHGLTSEFVKDKFYGWRFHGLISSDTDLELIIPIIINDQTLLNCLVGFEKIPSYQLPEKFDNFDILVRLLAKDFHGKLMNLFPVPVKEPEIPFEAPEVKEAEEEVPSYDDTYRKLLRKMKTYDDTTIRTAVDVITSLGTNKKVYTFRKEHILKNNISSLLKDSFDDAIALLKRINVIKESTSGVHFNWDIFEKSDIKTDQEGLMIEIFKEFLKKIQDYE
ncbi:MAG: hypothetical protein CEE43_16970 [Promethearchaeota archaeon Loki_b32]|nr:MAG: hypothetical protein CEE43_16970 [Candidatus Lokiarchaeota archaeon Loki_b32]